MKSFALKMVWNWARNKTKGLKHSSADWFREQVAAAKKESDFWKTGKITPEEFVRGGDELVHRYQYWEWGEPNPSIPGPWKGQPNKQYLVQRGARCYKRADQGVGDIADDDLVEDGFGSSDEQRAEEDEGWLKTASDKTSAIVLISGQTPGAKGEIEDEEEEIGDIDEELDGAVAVESVLQNESANS